MRLVTLILFASAFCFGQTNTAAPTAPSQATTPTPEAVMAPAAATASSADPNAVTIPAGTKIPLVLKQAISTKNGREDDAVYAETAFPFVLDGHILVPAGTYVQGRITHIERGGHIKGRAQVLMHFTSLIYPSGYTVMLPGYVDNTPGAEHSSVKDAEGTIRQDSQTGEKIEKVAGAAGTGAVIGGLSDGLKGAGIGAGIGGVVGSAIGLFGRGSDVRLDPGSSIEMIIQRPVTLDARKIQTVARANP